jgi:DNA-directed RNA polymerase subunit RPC12/RpoP
MVRENRDIKCPGCGRFIKKLASICPYCGAKTVVAPDKGGFICRNCGKRVPQRNIQPNKKDNISDIEHCPYCGVKI